MFYVFFLIQKSNVFELHFHNLMQNNTTLFNDWEANRPEYFPWGAWNNSMRSTARGQRPRATELDPRAIPSNDGKMFWSIDWSNFE